MKKSLITGIGILLIILNSIICYKVFFAREVVYADIGKLVDGYHLKKDLEKKLEKDLLTIKNVVDSLKMVHKLTPSPAIDSNIRRLEFEFGDYYDRANRQITNEVWNRLNPAIELFGKQKRYKLIIGANGAGTLLYGETRYDVTPELLYFVNTIYEKGN